MGEAQRLSPEEQLQFAREGFESGEDLTVAVEEEFAILDPSTHGLVNRFEEFAQAAVGTELEGHLVGELIASEVPIGRSRSRTSSAASCRSCSPSRQAHLSSKASTRTCTRRALRSSRACSPVAVSPTSLRTGTLMSATSASSTTPVRLPSTRRSGGACG